MATESPPLATSFRSALAAVLAVAVVGVAAVPARAAVLRVGTWKGRPGAYTSVQDAVDAARPGDWILIAPGDYHEQADHRAAGPATEPGAGVMIRTPNIHLRGLDRNGVVIDGTKPGSAPCDDSLDAQDFGPLDADGNPVGRNGIEAFEVDGVSIENLTVCNFLHVQDGGNEIWFNGGDGTGTVNMGPFTGTYLSATSTYYDDQGHRGEYGIFASNARGPGLFEHTYASNMGDASYYVGACPDCNQIVRDAHAENSALGYSGTNSGGHLIIEDSEWNDNKTGISTNSQNNDDAPSPQDGACPDGGIGPTGSHSCTLFRGNYIHDNNNPNVPSAGSAAFGPVGTGMVLAGGRNDTIIDNRVENQGSWGILVVPYPDSGPPPPIAHCEGGDTNVLPGFCYYDSWGHEVTGNFFKNVGFFGNDTNGDLAEISALHDPGNCWHDNKGLANTVTSSPENLQETHATCGVPNAGAALTDPLTGQVICATEVFGPCPDQPGLHYPRVTQVQLKPLPKEKSMPGACHGVPANPWCH